MKNKTIINIADFEQFEMHKILHFTPLCCGYEKGWNDWPDVEVDLGVEVDEEDGRNEAEDEGLAPVDVGRVARVDSQRRHVQT